MSQDYYAIKVNELGLLVCETQNSKMAVDAKPPAKMLDWDKECDATLHVPVEGDSLSYQEARAKLKANMQDWWTTVLEARKA